MLCNNSAAFRPCAALLVVCGLGVAISACTGTVPYRIQWPSGLANCFKYPFGLFTLCGCCGRGGEGRRRGRNFRRIFRLNPVYGCTRYPHVRPI